ncbi:unnamed protein product [Phytophthora lilii]|uniref:Unnamed protein product n=1 Tax=Phytophthora lilii TaxID=2077276 RepID=A0A9W6TT39_9STRA|nr:unnamed protein product [Phytophthora lilii]
MNARQEDSVDILNDLIEHEVPVYFVDNSDIITGRSWIFDDRLVAMANVSDSAMGPSTKKFNNYEDMAWSPHCRLKALSLKYDLRVVLATLQQDQLAPRRDLPRS